MKALDRKLLRDAARMPGQAITIVLVAAIGVATYVLSITTLRSLVASRDAYYSDSRFADVFARVVRAPRAALDRIAAIPGVSEVNGRITQPLRVEVDGFDEPILGIFTSAGSGDLNRLFIRAGRPLERDDEVLVSEQFANAHRLEPGQSLFAVLNGRRSRLRIAGIALAPEYVWVIQPGTFFSDDRRTGVFWMRHRALERALDFEGAFNDLALSVSPGASVPAIVDAVDRALEPYGSFGANGRDKQPSNRLITEELQQLETMAALLPAIFLGVAAFLVNVVLSRVIANQREQIASLKALGYRNRRLALHYAELALGVVTAGSLLGIALGAWAGDGFVTMYARYFHFPRLAYRLDPLTVVIAILVAAAAGLFGALGSLRRATRLAPAEAMRPEPPTTFRALRLERLGVVRWLPAITRMVLRDLLRRPLRLSLSALGIAFATAIIVAGNASMDAVTQVFDRQFDRMQLEDIEVTFAEPLAANAARSLASLPGGGHLELERRAPVRLRAGARSREVVLREVDPAARLRVLFDADDRPVRVPEDGLALSRPLAELLGVRVGERVDLELLQGDRRRRAIEVTTLIDDSLGLSAYLRPEPLRKLLGETALADAALLEIDPLQQADVEHRLTRLPAVTGLVRPSVAKALFRRQFADVLLLYELVLAGCAAAIAVGVVYNNARIALTARSRDLATLRILGFRRREVSTVLAGEQAVQLALGIPGGLALGTFLSHALYAQMDPELYRITVEVSARTYALAALIVLVAASASAWIIQRGVRRMDLVAVLKARD